MKRKNIFKIRCMMKLISRLCPKTFIVGWHTHIKRDSGPQFLNSKKAVKIAINRYKCRAELGQRTNAGKQNPPQQMFAMRSAKFEQKILANNPLKIYLQSTLPSLHARICSIARLAKTGFAFHKTHLFLSSMSSVRPGSTAVTRISNGQKKEEEDTFDERDFRTEGERAKRRSRTFSRTAGEPRGIFLFTAARSSPHRLCPPHW